MAAKVWFKSGNTETINYTPSGSTIMAGDVVTVGNLVGVCHRSIPDGELGALHVTGGIYTGPGDAAISAGVTVYFNTTTNKFTTTAGSFKKFGTAVTACTGDGANMDVLHQHVVG